MTARAARPPPRWLDSCRTPRVTAQAFIASILGLSAVLTHPGNAVEPQQANPKPGAVAEFERATARKAAVAILKEVRLLDFAARQWSLENNPPASATPVPADLAPYFKKGTRLHAELSAGRCNDALGNPISLQSSDRPPLLSKATVQQFATVVLPGFWGGFYEGPEVATAPAPEPAPANPTTEQELRMTATRLVEEMRMLVSALDRWAIDHNQRDGAQALPAYLLPYLQPGTRLHGELAAGRTNDSLGNPIKIPRIGKSPTISPATATRLAPVVPPDFWGPFVAK